MTPLLGFITIVLDIWRICLRKLLALIIILLTFSPLIFSQRTLFVGTIPLNGKIPLEEEFSLDVTLQTPFLFNQNIAGGQYQIAKYDFSSNSPDLLYHMKLSPGLDTRLGKGIFAFRNISETGVDTGGAPIPFRLVVKGTEEDKEVSNSEFRSVKKNIGILNGSRYKESGLIFVAFPSISEGFVIKDFLSGFYEASVFVEVLVD